jgi:hypothetical protein
MSCSNTAPSHPTDVTSSSIDESIAQASSMLTAPSTSSALSLAWVPALWSSREQSDVYLAANVERLPRQGCPGKVIKVRFVTVISEIEVRAITKVLFSVFYVPCSNRAVRFSLLCCSEHTKSRSVRQELKPRTA